jgi:hypothetical protein
LPNPQRHIIYRDNAGKLQKAIAEANGLSVAAATSLTHVDFRFLSRP